MTINRYIRIFFIFMRQSWMALSEYRTNFILYILIDAGWTSMDIIFSALLVSNIQSIGTWDLPRALIAVGVFRVMVPAVWGWLYPSFVELPKLVNEGTLDLVLAKPLSSQFLVSFQKFGFNLAPSVIGGICLIVYGLVLAGLSVSLPQVILFLWLLFISAILIYGVYFSTMTLCLYGQRLNNINQFFAESYYNISKYPPQMFPFIIQRIFITVFPLALIISVPAEILFAPLNIYTLLYFHLLAICFLFISSFLWNTGLRHYSSASS